VSVDESSAGRKGKFSTVLSILNVTVSAVALFLITGYAPFAIAALLGKSLRMEGVPAGFIVSAVFLSMAVGTLLSCFRTGTGLIVGPAVGLASFVSQTSVQTIGTGQFVAASFLASAAAVFLSLAKGKNKDPNKRMSLRQEFLDAIPEPVKIGVRGGIGSLLAAAAIHGLQDVAREAATFYSYALHLFVIGTAVLLVTEVLQEKLEGDADRSWLTDLGVLVLRLVSALLPLLWLFLLYKRNAFHLPTVNFELQLPDAFPPFDPFNTSGVSGTGLSIAMTTFCFTVVILFVFLIDIPGSPYDFLKKKAENPEQAAEIIDRSFVVTSTTSMLNPFLGLYTSVYYAENHAIVRRDDNLVVSAATGFICTLLFLLLAAGFLLADLHVDEIKLWILIALAPTLFTIGVRMTARALKHESEEGRVPSYYYVPAALTLLLTHFIGFEIALPIGVVYYGAYRWAAGDQKVVEDRTEAEKRAENWFAGLLVLSFLIVLALGAIKLGYG
jgi:hypothetical protein